MPHADKLSRFPCEAVTPDLHLQVVTDAAHLPPVAGPFGGDGDWKCSRTADGRQVFAHRGGKRIWVTDDCFDRVLLYLAPSLPEWEVLRYLHAVQAFSHHLQYHGGCLLHSAGLRFETAGIALCGRSGVGKSTLTHHLQALCPHMTVLSEDMPAIIEAANGAMLYGTPFCGQDEQCENAAAPLRAIVLLRQAAHNRLLCPDARDAFFTLLSTVPRPPFCEDAAVRATDRLLRLYERVPVLLFENDGTPAAAAYWLTAMQEYLK